MQRNVDGGGGRERKRTARSDGSGYREVAKEAREPVSGTCPLCGLHGGERTCPGYAKDRCGRGKGVVGCTLTSEHSWRIHKATRKEIRADLERVHGANIVYLVKERSDDRASSG